MRPLSSSETASAAVAAPAREPPTLMVYRGPVSSAGASSSSAAVSSGAGAGAGSGSMFGRSMMVAGFEEGELA